MSTPKPPTPNPSKDYKKSLQVYLKYLPALLGGEQSARELYDPARIASQQKLQEQFGPTQYKQQLSALGQLDPQSMAIRGKLAQNVYGDLASGYKLPADFNTELTSQIRGAEAVRGNEMGAAPIAAESLYKGNAALNLYQQHLQNAGNFLAGPTPEQALLAVQPVAPDRASQYVNPSAAGQLAAPQYSNLLAQWQASGAGRNPWQGALAGAVGGAAQGTTISPGYGTAIGAIAGGIGGYFSDNRLKLNIRYIGKSPSGIPIAQFNYKDCTGEFEGCIAQDVLRIRPDAVVMDGSGYWKVLYDKIDVEYKELITA